jgi:hypothetical protein
MAKQEWAILDSGAELVFSCQDCGAIFKFATEELASMSALQLVFCLEAHGCYQEIRLQTSKFTGAA